MAKLPKMKLQIFKPITFILLLAFIGVGCNDEEPKPLNLYIGMNIYKTRNDYFNNVHLNLIDGKVNSKPSLINKVDIDENGEPHYRNRIKLHKGYILGTAESYNHTVFLSYTIKEYYNMEADPAHPTIPTINELTEHFIDRDPFTEYFTDPNDPPRFQLEDSTLINQIIDENKLERFFKSLK
jgi:hypothetical protein